jgi:hypothetical protein
MTEGNGIGTLQIVRRIVHQGKDDLSFSVSVEPPADFAHDTRAFQSNINAVLDVLGEVAQREEWKAGLDEKRKALRVAQEQALTAQRELDALRVRRMATESAQFAINRNRRTSEQTSKQKAELQAFDDQIEQGEIAKRNFASDVPIIEWGIACLVAKINGEIEPEKPTELLALVVDSVRHAA